jgi:hypothetical protein
MNKIIKLIITIILFIFSFSCQQNNGKKFNSNADFERKYKKEVNQINKGRIIKDSKKTSEFEKLNPSNIDNLLTPELQNKNSSNIANSFSYVDISKIGINNAENQYFPNYETYERNINNGPKNQFSPKIFEINYNTSLNLPFNQIGAEFDYINIPDYDKSGIESSSKDKKYTLIPILSLQNAIKILKDSRNDEDLEFSKKIIVEKKSLDRKKNLEQYQEKNEYLDFINKSKNFDKQ